jgi:ubiquinone biosynthesis protein UbiJ
MKRVGIFLIMVALIVGVVGFGGDGDGDGNSNGNGGESCTLTIDSTTGGAVTVDNVAIPGGLILTYDAGTLVSLNATPDSGYQFVRWTGDVYTVDDVRASETIITVNGDYSIMADFEVLPPARYSLSIIGPVHGSVTTPGEGTLLIYEEGTVVNLVAKPDSGYEFARWTGDVDTIANINASSTTITMNGDYYICAHFREIPVVC